MLVVDRRRRQNAIRERADVSLDEAEGFADPRSDPDVDVFLEIVEVPSRSPHRSR